MIDVTAALIRKNGRVLICRRPEGKEYAGLWEFPGGKVEKGETLENCLIRECREELGFTASPVRLTAVSEGAGAGSRVRLHFFVCDIAEGEPKALEHSAIRWILPQETGEYVFCESDAAMLRAHSLSECLND